MIIRRGTADDCEALHRLIASAYRGEDSTRGWTSEHHLLDGERLTLAELAALLADGQVTWLVGEERGEVVACAALTRTPEGAEFGKFAVSPDRQGGGLGKAMLAAAEAVLAEDFGGGLMTMTVIRGRSELIAFYGRRGYRPTGESLPLAQVHEAPGWTRGRDLLLDVYAKVIPVTR